MNPVIAAIITQVVLALLQNCPEEKEDRILKLFHDPGPLMKIKLEGAIRRQLNLSPRDWRDKGAALMAPVYSEGRAVTLDDVKELIQMAKA